MTHPWLPPWFGTRSAQAAMIAVAVAFVATQLAAVFTESVNWDELALLQRAEAAATTGRLHGGGRPGLGVIVLVPFVKDCGDTMTAVIHARLLWCAFTVALLAGLFALVFRAVRAPTQRWHAAALGVAAIALVPVFLRWSVQVRSDQPAIAAALWGGVAVLASRRRPRLAAVAGALIALGYLFSQKAIYVAGLGGLVALGDLVIDRDVAWSRELRRAGWAAAGAAVVLVAWAVILPVFYAAAPPVGVGHGLDVLDYYRQRFGYRVYRGMLPTLYPQLVTCQLLLLAMLAASRRKTAHLRPLAVGLAVAVAGLAVGAFHAAAFPYFWMTLGLFPAVAIGLAWPGIAAMLPRAGVVVAVALWAWLLWIAVPYRREVLADTQAVQRDSFAFIDRELDAAARGFHADGGLFCRRDPAPLPVYMRESVERTFGGPDGDRQVELLLAEFRTRPVAFVVDDFLLTAFPPKVRAFWATHYVPYHAAVAVAGRRLRGPAGTRVDVDVIVAGDYRWFGPGPIVLDGARLAPGATTRLATGAHVAELLTDTRGGMLALALAVPPRPGRAPFHAAAPVAEISGLRADW